MTGDGDPARLTVVMPTHNHGRFIATALDSLIGQTRQPDRVLIINDASQDDTAGIIAAYAERHAWIDVETNARNRGVIACLNAGLAAVETDYVTFLASDDFVMPRLCETSLRLLADHRQAGLCSVLCRWVDEAGRPLRQPRPPLLTQEARYLPPAEIAAILLRHGSVFGGNGTVYRTAALRDAGGFDAELGSFCDGYATQLLSLRHGACHVPEILAAWRRLRDSYATRSQVDPGGCRATLNAIVRRLASTDRGDFPAAHRARLERRARFALGAAALQVERTDRDALREALGASWLWLCPILHGARRLAGSGGPLLLLMAVLRPWDLLPAIARRLFAWPAGSRPVMLQD